MTTYEVEWVETNKTHYKGKVTVPDTVEISRFPDEEMKQIERFIGDTATKYVIDRHIVPETIPMRKIAVVKAEKEVGT